jgi:hypothetical protein
VDVRGHLEREEEEEDGVERGGRLPHSRTAAAVALAHLELLERD